MSNEMIHAPQTRDAAESRRVQAIVQAIESAADVRRRNQFFTWTQGSVQTLLPHKLAICGVYERHRKEVRLEVFNSIVIPAPVVAHLTDGQSQLMQHIINAWIDNRGRAMVIRLASPSNRTISPTVEALQALGFDELLVHGVSRPQRASEIETLFVFASPGETVSESQTGGLELILPHLHSTYLRVQSIERELTQVPPSPTPSGNGYAGASISDRERQVLGWVREGMSNQQIGLQLGISPLTVKNHIQKLLRKLGATNRAQAVARAMSMNLLVNGSQSKGPGTK